MHCIKCAANTDQTLQPCDKGAEWKCTSCGNTHFAYDFSAMATIVKQKVFGIREDPTVPTIPTGYRVFLKHDIHGESEVPGEAIIEHCRACGNLPQVGKPMFAIKMGFPVPYGEVVRIEKADIL